MIVFVIYPIENSFGQRMIVGDQAVVVAVVFGFANRKVGVASVHAGKI